MSAETFQILVDKVSLRMQKQDTRYRNAIIVHKRVAIAVWRLATGNCYRAVGKVFGVSANNSCTILLQFCTELVRTAHESIIFPAKANETAIAI